MHAVCSKRAVRGVVRLAGAAVAAVACLVVGAGPAAAHTELVASTPAPQSQLSEPPSSVELRFSADVEAAADAVRVFDADARRVDTNPAARGRDPKTVAVALAAGLGPGTYTTSWRVVAADGHPLEGAFTFRVGTTAQQVAATAGTDGSTPAAGGVIGAATALSRWLMYVGLIVLVGGAAFAGWMWPTGWADRRAARLRWAAWSAAVVGTVAMLLLQGPAVTGRGLSAVTDLELLGEVVRSRFGTVATVRLGLLAAAAVLLLLHRRPRRATVAVAAVVGAGLLVTPTLSAHGASAANAPLAVALDVLHLGALALWLGGLAVLTAVTLRAGADARAVVSRFSRVALICVVVVLVTGTTQAWREVGTLGALTRTRYGALLIVKVVAFVAVMAAAAFSRRWVRARTSDASSLRRSVAAEAVLAGAVLGVAAVLVTTPPARTAYAAPYRAVLPVAQLRLHLTVTPAKAGPVTLEVRLRGAAGADAQASFVVVDLRLPAHDIGPLRVRMQRVSASHYRATGVELPLPGRWQLEAGVFGATGRQVASTSFDVA